MKRVLGLFLSVLMLSGCVGAQSSSGPWMSRANPTAVAAPSSIAAGPAAPAAAPATIAQGQTAAKVALLLPLSGKNASLGQSMLQSAQLALFDMGNRNFQLMPRDTGGTPEGARAAAESAINDGAQLILGPLFSAEARAVKPVAASHNINMVSFSTDWTQGGGNAFVMGFLPFSQVQRIVEYSSAKGLRRIGLVAPQSDYGNAVTSFFQALASRSGLQAAPVVRIGQGSVSGSFAQNGAPTVDAVLIAVGGAQASSIAGELTRAGLQPERIKRLGTGLWDDSTLSSDANMQGAWYAAPQPDLRRAFERKYFNTYGAAAPRLATLSYDATALASVLARNGAGNGNAAFDRNALSSPNGFSGIDGIFRFGRDGLIDRGMAVLQMDRGAVGIIDPAPKTFQKLAY